MYFFIYEINDKMGMEGTNAKDLLRKSVFIMEPDMRDSQMYKG